MKIITFGEMLIRLSPPNHLRLSQTSHLEMNFGGAEANVAVALALWGEETSYITRLPRNLVAEAAVQKIRGFGVQTQQILWGGDRMGIYFLETGAAQRASTVTYDRAHSAFAEMDPREFNWEQLLAGAGWFHCTGISPAVSAPAAQATLEAVRMARKLGLKVSCDLNFRAKLWTMKQARETLTPLLEHVNYLITNGEAAETVFELEIAGAARSGMDVKREMDVAAQMTKRFGFDAIAITQRESCSASHNKWSGLYYTQGQAYYGRSYDLHIVDRVGGGDAFAAGLIHAVIHGKKPQETIDFALAAGCLKHAVPGDFNLVKVSEIEMLLAGDGTGRVQR